MIRKGRKRNTFPDKTGLPQKLKVYPRRIRRIERDSSKMRGKKTGKADARTEPVSSAGVKNAAKHSGFHSLHRSEALIDCRTSTTEVTTLPRGVIGSTTDSGSVSWGSSPCGVILLFQTEAKEKVFPSPFFVYCRGVIRQRLSPNVFGR